MVALFQMNERCLNPRHLLTDKFLYEFDLLGVGSALSYFPGRRPPLHIAFKHIVWGNVCTYRNNETSIQLYVSYLIPTMDGVSNPPESDTSILATISSLKFTNTGRDQSQSQNRGNHRSRRLLAFF